MELGFIDSEISEARLYRSSRSFGAFDGRDIADLLFLTSLSVYLLSREDQTISVANAYAKKTVQYGSYALFRSIATDLYLLAYTLLHPGNDHVTLVDAVASKKFLSSCNFNQAEHITFLRRLTTNYMDDDRAYRYFFKLEQQLKIKDPRYKQWRRNIASWDKSTEAERNKIKAKIIREFVRLGARSNELLPALSSQLTARRKQDVWKGNKDYVDPNKPSAAKRIAGTAAGAVAGRYAAGKLAKMDPKKAKNIGTGIGAIAGYWASGRRRQK